MLITPGRSPKVAWIVCWKISAAEDKPKFKRLYRYNPAWVENTVYWRDSGASSIW